MKFHTSFGIAIILVIASVHLAYGANGDAADSTTPVLTTDSTNTTTMPTTVSPITTPPSNTTTTVQPTTTTSTLAPNTTTSAPTTSTTSAPTSSTTLAPTTTPAPVTSTTPKPEPQPCHRFDTPSFIGGIVLAFGLIAIGFVSLKIYKSKTERNYHTL